MKTMKYTFGVQEIRNGIPTETTIAFEEACQAATRIIDEGKYGLTEGDFYGTGKEVDAGTTYLYQNLILRHDGLKKVNKNLSVEKQFNPFFLLNPANRNEETGMGELNLQQMVPLDQEGVTRVLSYISYPTVKYPNAPFAYVTAEVNKANVGGFGYPASTLQKRIFDRVVLEVSEIGFNGIHGDAEAKDFEEAVQVKSNVLTPVKPVAEPATSAVEAEPVKEKAKTSRKRAEKVAPAVTEPVQEELPFPVEETKPAPAPAAEPKEEKVTAAAPAGKVHSEVVTMTLEEAMDYVAVEGPMKGRVLASAITAVDASNTERCNLAKRCLAGYRTSGSPADREVASMLLAALRDPNSPVKFRGE